MSTRGTWCAAPSPSGGRALPRYYRASPTFTACTCAQDDKTALDYAKLNKHLDVVAFLEVWPRLGLAMREGASGERALATATTAPPRDGTRESSPTMLVWRAQNDASALYWAAYWGMKDYAKGLIEKGVDMEACVDKVGGGSLSSLPCPPPRADHALVERAQPPPPPPRDPDPLLHALDPAE